MPTPDNAYAQDTESAAAQSHKWLVVAAVMLGAVLQILDSAIVNVALPYMQASFGVGIEQVTWVVTSYLVAVSVTIPMTAWLAVRIGRKRYFLFSVAMFVIASAMCGLARGISEIVIFRLIQGAAGAAMIPLSQAILLETFPVEEHTLAMTTFGIGMMVAPVFGPTLGGWITINWGWRWIFFINVPTGTFAAVMVYSFVHDPGYLLKQRGTGRVDYLGIILVILALGLFQLILARGGSDGWFAASWIRYSAAVSAISAGLLVLHELRFTEPIIDLRLFKLFSFTLAVVLMSMQALALFGINLLNPLFMETVLGYDAWKAGLAVAPRGIGVVIALLIVGQISRRGSDTRPLVCVGFLLAAYEILQMSRWTLDANVSAVLWPIFLFGLGLGAVFPTVTALGVGQIRRERMGYASSLFSMMINTGAATGIALITNALTARHHIHQTRMMLTVDGARHVVTHALSSQAWLLAYNDIYRVLALVALLLAPWCMFLKRRHVSVED
jgi:DHA2 family multidrug resistance protein